MILNVGTMCSKILTVSALSADSRMAPDKYKINRNLIEISRQDLDCESNNVGRQLNYQNNFLSVEIIFP